MKFVFMIEEVAGALSMSVAEFAKVRCNLEAMGFPEPIRGLHERWSIMDVINWVNRAKPADIVTPTFLAGNASRDLN